jgi:dTDP-4-amino-4,6-dideoxygalactose transaminase
MTQHNRRNFLNSTFIAASGFGLTAGMVSSAQPNLAQPAVDQKTADQQTKRIPKAKREWPIWDETEETALINVLNSGTWGRTGGGPRCAEFEAAFAKRHQAKYCVLTSSGTTALLTAIGALEIGPGDEVILPPYTFVASFNVITNSYALPVFVDTDLDTFQIDPAKIETAVTPATRLILPVHIGGYSADMDAINAIAKKHSLSVIEDACQAPLAEWRGTPVGTQGTGGCFSFQSSKNLNSGEGGAITTNDENFFHQCFNFHTPGGGKPASSAGRGSNYRITEFQAALLLAQYARFEKQSAERNTNGNYLTQLLQEIPGIAPAKFTTGCTRSAYHLYMFRYDPKHFAGMPRAKFLAELGRLGVGASGGYGPLNTTPHVLAIASNPHYQRIYGKVRMADWLEKNQCPINDRLCQEAVWFSQYALLGDRSRMDRIADAIRELQKRSS